MEVFPVGVPVRGAHLRGVLLRGRVAAEGDGMTEPTTYKSRTDLVRAALGCLLRGLATQRAFFASLEQRSDDTAAGLIRALESAHGEDEFKAALDDASVDVALVVDAAREM